MNRHHSTAQPTVAVADHLALARQLRNDYFSQRCIQGWRQLVALGVLLNRRQPQRITRRHSWLSHH
ncbi:MAG: hypothetical protein R3E79_46860 [Caldilineaceae bacterium]